MRKPSDYDDSDEAFAYVDAIIEHRKNNPPTEEWVMRKAFICIGCEGVYSDEPVSRCDCMIHTEHPEGTNLFYEGTIQYPKKLNK